jgi:SnoaL-like domain
MSIDQNALAILLAKEAIRELGLLYSRGVDRKDAALLRTLYTKDATDTHGDTFDGKADDYVDFLERAFPYMAYSAHHVCNHLISVNGNEGDGEIYAIAYHIIPDGKGGWMEDLMCVRYIDRYRKEEDNRWRFAKRVVTYDMRTRRPIAAPDQSKAAPTDPSYIELKSRLFARGGRAEL